MTIDKGAAVDADLPDASASSLDTPQFMRTAGRFLMDFVAFRPLALGAASLLLLARSLTEGVSYLLLAPLLEFVGVGAAKDSAIHHVLRSIESWTGFRLTLESVLALIFALVLARAALGYGWAMVSARLQTDYFDQVRQRIYRALSRANWLHLTTVSGGRDTHALTMQIEHIGYAVNYVVQIAAGVLTLAVAIGAALFVSPRLTLATLLAIVLVAAPMALFNRSAFAQGSAALRALQDLYEAIVNRMNGLKLAKAFSIERDLERDFAASSSAYRRATVALRRNMARGSFLQECGAVLALIALLYVSARVLQTPAIELIVIIAIFSRIAPWIGVVQSNLQWLASSLPNVAATQSLEARALRNAEPLPDDSAPTPLREAIDLAHVRFTYPGAARPALDGVNLRLDAHSAIGVVGLSGAGKSTLADLVAGLIAPDAGVIAIDGIALDERTRMRWRPNVAYVPQDAPLFHDTLRANLRVGARHASDDEIEAALDLVGARDLVASLPQGLDTLAGDRGLRLSGGERQRIRLASALLRKPQLLVLDEATSALSEPDEARIVAALGSLRAQMTIVVIAHRASSISWTDRALLVQNGRIAGDGAPAQILARFTQQSAADNQPAAPAVSTPP